MKIYFKVGLLIIILLVPAFVYIFMKSFGNNHYTLPKMIPIDVVEKQFNNKTVSDTVFHKVSNFELLSSNGKKFGATQLNGKVFVADFFFTRCQSICPKMSTQLSRVQSAFAEDSLVQLVSFSVDPDYDTKEVLNTYSSKFNANPKIWHFLLGSKSEIYKLAKYDFKITALDDPNGGEEFVHSDKLILVDKEKHIRGFYDGTDPKEVDRLITELKVLLYEYENK